MSEREWAQDEIDADMEEEFEDDAGYCNCNAMHDDTELGGICSACGGIVD